MGSSNGAPGTGSDIGQGVDLLGRAFSGIINPIAGIFGGIGASNRMGDLMRVRNDALALVRDNITPNQMPTGAPWDLYASSYSPYMGMLNGMGANDFFPDFFRMNMSNYNGMLGNYYQNQLPGYGNVNYQNSFFDNYFMPNIYGNQGRMDTLGDAAYNNYASNGANPYSGGIYDQVMGGLNSPFIPSQMNVGNYYLQNGGNTTDNYAMLQLGYGGMGNGGYNPQVQGTYNAGQGLVNSQFSPLASGLMNYGMQGINQFANNQNPEQFLGPIGQSAMGGLMNSPYVTGAFGAANNYLGQATQNGGYTPQDQYMFSQSAPRGFDTYDRLSQNVSQDRNAVYGNMTDPNSLPTWFQGLQDLMLGPQGIGGLSGMGSVSGGGGGGSFAAPTISRDTGPLDPKMEDFINKTMAEWDQNPVLGMNEARGLARNRALADYKSGLNQAYSRAVQLGGAGPRIAAGGAGNQAIFENEDRLLEGLSNADSQAILNQQGLGIQRDSQAAALQQALQQIKQNREQMFMGANIADAQNATQAGIASLNSQDAAAGRALQASSINAQNSLAAAQMKAAMMGQLMGNATDIYKTNMNSNLGSLGLLQGMQNTMLGQSGQMFGNTANAGQNANNRFGMGSNAFGAMNQAGQNDINRYSTIFNPLIAGQNTATNRAGLYTGFPSTGLTSGLNSQDNRIGTGMSGMMGANNSANANLNSYANIWGMGNNDQNNRMRFGLDSINSGFNNMGNLLGQGNNAVGTQLGYANNAGQLGNSLANTSSGMWNNALSGYRGFGQDNLAGQQLNQTGYNNFFPNYNSMFNPFFQGMGQYSSGQNNIMDQQMRYMLGAQGLWGNYLNASTVGLGGNGNFFGGR